jgi:hemerythrin
MGSATDPGSHGCFVVEWREGFRTGIDEIDAEHRQLFAMVKRLDASNVKAMMNDVVEYVVTHFTHEEALMERSGYPGLQRHVEMHEGLATRVSEFLVGGAAWSEHRVQELRTFLNKWLVGHILTHDLHFGRWYHAKGPTTQPLPLPEDPGSSLFGRLFGKR